MLFVQALVVSILLAITWLTLFVLEFLDSTLIAAVEKEAANTPPLSKEEAAENIKESDSQSDTENVTKSTKKSSNQSQTENLAQSTQETNSQNETEIVSKSTKESASQNHTEIFKKSTKKSASQNQIEYLIKSTKESASQNQIENVARPPTEGIANIIFISRVQSKCCISSECRIHSCLVSPAAMPKHGCWKSKLRSSCAASAPMTDPSPWHHQIYIFKRLLWVGRVALAALGFYSKHQHGASSHL